MKPTQELVDDIYKERIQRARVTPPEQKLLDSFRLFEFSLGIMLDGIRDENPGADDKRVQELLARRFEILTQLEPVE